MLVGLWLMSPWSCVQVNNVFFFGFFFVFTVIEVMELEAIVEDRKNDKRKDTRLLLIVKFDILKGFKSQF